MISVAGGVPIGGGRILLGKRSAHRKLYPLTWDMIGGHVEAGETPEQALVREFREEVGIRPTRFHLIDEIIVPEANDRALLFVFRIDGWSGEPRLANNEHSELRWFDTDDITEACPLASDLYLPLFQSLIGSR